ncbi:unnamed protein product [Nyctereutes procyonoides]|uniref:(raccoon dog) hypothetical protein n=1 Tax=Nyctereutes procyonoides TaxID=34880 RepID=A0A811YVG6_NYCPR|nr:unnamed protein product [Nyctereutes procyonoides]CAD7688312.1 unnamed protein product [Nyctereutes procyonoides]
MGCQQGSPGRQGSTWEDRAALPHAGQSQEGFAGGSRSAVSVRRWWVSARGPERPGCREAAWWLRIQGEAAEQMLRRDHRPAEGRQEGSAAGPVLGSSNLPFQTFPHVILGPHSTTPGTCPAHCAVFTGRPGGSMWPWVLSRIGFLPPGGRKQVIRVITWSTPSPEREPGWPSRYSRREQMHILWGARGSHGMEGEGKVIRTQAHAHDMGAGGRACSGSLGKQRASEALNAERVHVGDPCPKCSDVGVASGKMVFPADVERWALMRVRVCPLSTLGPRGKQEEKVMCSHHTTA